MIHWLAAAALAASMDSRALTEAEVAANALIADCELRGTECDVPRESLGEAYLVRATAAVLLRGEVDPRASANARLLVPDEAQKWTDLLSGAPDVEPDAHLLAWTVPPEPVFRERVVLGERSPELPVELDLKPRPRPTRRGPPTEPFRPGGATVVGMQVGRSFSDIPLETRLGGRHTLTGALTAVIDVDWGLTLEALPRTDLPALDVRGHYVRADAGIGLRRSRSHTETFGYVGATFARASLFPDSQRALADNDVSTGAGSMDPGGLAGFFVWFGSRRGGPLGLQVDNRLTVTAHIPLRTGYLADQVEQPRPTARLSTLSDLELTVDLREQPIRFALGTTLLTSNGSLSNGLPRIDVIPHVEAALRFGGPR